MRIYSHSRPRFPAFGLNTERYEVSRIQSECRKMRSRITPNTDTFRAMSMIQIKSIYVEDSKVFIWEETLPVFTYLNSMTFSNVFIVTVIRFHTFFWCSHCISFDKISLEIFKNQRSTDQRKAWNLELYSCL